MTRYRVRLETKPLHAEAPDKGATEATARENPSLAMSPRGDGSFVAEIEVDAPDEDQASSLARDRVLAALRAAGRQVTAEDIHSIEVERLPES